MDDKRREKIEKDLILWHELDELSAELNVRISEIEEERDDLSNRRSSVEKRLYMCRPKEYAQNVLEVIEEIYEPDTDFGCNLDCMRSLINTVSKQPDSFELSEYWDKEQIDLYNLKDFEE